MRHVLNLLVEQGRLLLQSTREMENLTSRLPNRRELLKSLQAHITKTEKQGQRVKETTYQQLAELTDQIQADQQDLANAESRKAQVTLTLKLIAAEAPDALDELRKAQLLAGDPDRIHIIKALLPFFPQPVSPPPPPPPPPPPDPLIPAQVYINGSSIPAQLGKIRRHVTALQERYPYPNPTCPELNILYIRGLSCRQKLSELYAWDPEYCRKTLNYHVI